MCNRARELSCPQCQHVLSWSQIGFGPPFPCPGCNARLVVQRGYHRNFMWASATIVGLLGYSVGFRGTELLVAAAIGLLPMQMILLGTVARAFPPRLRTFDDGTLNLKPPSA